MSRGDPELAVIEEMLRRGTSGLSSADVRALCTEHGHDGGELIEQILEGDCQPEALVEAFVEARRREIDRLKPPRLEAGGRDQEQLLRALNLSVGARGGPRRTSGQSLLDRLAAAPVHLAATRIDQVNDVSLLWCLVRSGRIGERRAAVRRLGELIRRGELECEGLDDRDVLEGLAAIRDPRIAFEVDEVLAEVSGAIGRTARQRRARVDRLLEQVDHQVARFWSGEREVDPVQGLSREELHRLGIWLRRAPDELAAHLTEHLRALLDRGETSDLTDTVGALIPSGDERLVPVLQRVLEDGPLSARIATARALGRISDPRVHPALRAAYRGSSDPTAKIVLGGALGQFGDRRALSFLLDRLEQERPSTLAEEVVRSLGSIGSAEAGPKLVPLLDDERGPLVRAAARALVRCGGVEQLHALQRQTSTRQPQGNVLGDAAEALALRLQLTDQLTDEDERPVMPLASAKRQRAIAAAEATEPDLQQRLRATSAFLLGLLWLALWQRPRALAAFSAAARLDPRAAAPHLREAALHAASSRDDLAIAAYRRALRANRRWVLRRPSWVQRLLRSYLRRADALVARRRRREALTLLDEVASLDLRQADLDLRLAMTRRRDRLLVDRTPSRLPKR